MKYSIIFFVLVFFSFSLVSCKSNQNDKKVAERKEEMSDKKEEKDEESWEIFFEEFKSAAVASDLEKIKDMTDFRSMKADVYPDELNFYFNEETIKKFDAAKATDATAAPDQKFEGEIIAKDVMKLSFEEKNSEGGAETDSGMYFFFGRIEGKYKLISIMLAG